MDDGTAKGFWMSAALHGSVAVALFFFTVVLKSSAPDEAKVFELVAGEGDNYMASEAPALGTPGGGKVEIPDPPAPRPSPPQPAPQEVTPITPAPAPKNVTPTKAPDPTVPNFKKQIVQKVIRAESQAKRDIAKERAAEKKRQEEEAKKEKEREKKEREKREKENPSMTKEEYDRSQSSKTKTVASANKSNSPKAPKIDYEGIAKGVIGGSTANKVGGAGGKAMKTDNTDVLAGYDALFKQRLRAEFEPPPGLSDSLKAEVEVRSSADGTLSGGRVTKSSGSAEFDRAVLDALRRVRMPPRPDKKSETIEFTFTMRDRSEG